MLYETTLRTAIKSKHVVEGKDAISWLDWGSLLVTYVDVSWTCVIPQYDQWSSNVSVVKWHIIARDCWTYRWLTGEYVSHKKFRWITPISLYPLKLLFCGLTGTCQTKFPRTYSMSLRMVLCFESLCFLFWTFIEINKKFRNIRISYPCCLFIVSFGEAMSTY